MSAIQKKMVVVSRTFPPQVAGSSVLLSNMLNDYTGSFEAITGYYAGLNSDKSFIAPCNTKQFYFKNKLFNLIFEEYIHYFRFLIKYFIKKNLRKQKPDVVFNVFPDAVWFVATYEACSELGIPYFIHMHDLWEENFPNTNDPIGKLGRKFEPLIFKHARKVFCMTDMQQEHYEEKYNIKTELLLHTVPHHLLQEQPKPFKESQSTEKIILYSGNISDAMNLDAIRTFIDCIQYLPFEYKIVFLTSPDTERLKAKNIYHERIEYKWVSKSEAALLQQKADVLFLPLSFKNGALEEVKTVYATKTLDYLLAGKPILVFSPPFSYHSISAKKTGWGYVVEEDNALLLANSIISLVNQTELVSSITGNAYNEALRRDSLKQAGILHDAVNSI